MTLIWLLFAIKPIRAMSNNGNSVTSLDGRRLSYDPEVDDSLESIESNFVYELGVGEAFDE